MLKVLHLLSQTELTGSEVYAKVISDSQKKLGYQLVFVSDAFHLELQGNCYSLPISDGGLLSRLKNAAHLRKIIQKHSINLIHCHSRAACRVAFAAREGLGFGIGTSLNPFQRRPTSLKNLAVVSTLHGEQHFSWSKRWHDIYGDTVVCVAEPIREQLIQQFRMAPEKIKVLRNPLAWAVRVKSQRSAENAGSADNVDPAATAGSSSDRRVALNTKIRVLIAGRDSGPKGERLRKLLENEVSGWHKKFPQIEISVLQAGTLTRDFLNKPGCEDWHWVQAPSGLEELYQASEIVIGGGRIALEATSKGCETIAFGEKKIIGWLKDSNWSLAVDSNFGDMGIVEEFNSGAITAALAEIVNVKKDGISVHEVSTEIVQGTCGLQEKNFAPFDLKTITARLDEVYRGALLSRVAPNLPILMYHKVVPETSSAKHRIFVTTKTFEKHLQFFKSFGFQTLTFQELQQFWSGSKPLTDFPRRPLVLTFDDGYRNVLENAAPLLKKFGMKASLFILSDRSLLKNNWDEPDPNENPEHSRLMDQEDLQRLRTYGFELESHGVDHKNFTQLNEDQVFDQLKKSKLQIEADFSIEVSAAAYPFGAIDGRLPALAKKAGYSFAVNTDQGGLRWFDEPHSLFRINIFPEDSWFDLWRKTLPWYRRRYYRRRNR